MNYWFESYLSSVKTFGEAIIFFLQARTLDSTLVQTLMAGGREVLTFSITSLEQSVGWTLWLETQDNWSASEKFLIQSGALVSMWLCYFSLHKFIEVPKILIFLHKHKSMLNQIEVTFSLSEACLYI